IPPCGGPACRRRDRGARVGCSQSALLHAIGAWMPRRYRRWGGDFVPRPPMRHTGRVARTRRRAVVDHDRTTEDVGLAGRARRGGWAITRRRSGRATRPTAWTRRDTFTAAADRFRRDVARPGEVTAPVSTGELRSCHVCERAGGALHDA